jgi:y4mF family transcriptional regulator
MEFVKEKRKQLQLTQEEFAAKAGVALSVIRKIEQGKDNVSVSKVNQVLKMLGHTVGPINEHQKIIKHSLNDDMEPLNDNKENPDEISRVTRPQMSVKNRWLHPTDSFGKMEKGTE